MTLKRWILTILTLVAVSFLGLSLLDSWTQPQIQSRLELYQTNLVLNASEWQGQPENSEQLTTLRDNIIGKNSVQTALEQYQQVQKSAEKNLTQEQLPPSLVQDLTQLNQEAQMRIGILQATLGKTDAAFQTWQPLIEFAPPQSPTQQTARVLSGLWSEPARLLPNAEPILRGQLKGWFRYQALVKLYTLQQRSDALDQLNGQQQQIAEEAVFKLAFVSAIPGGGLFIGVLLLVGLGIQALIKRKDSILAQNSDQAWSIPWDAETVIQVFVVGFSLLGQLVIPILLRIVVQQLKLQPSSFDARTQAIYVLMTYFLLMAAGFSVLYLSIKSYFPLPEGWFRFNLKGNWFLWGLGGYFVALPLVILVSLVNQKLWNGQGGSNPLLPIALESRDSVALAIFFLTASVAAPIFEEIMFRGFLLPSLTRNFSLTGSIILSGFLFAIAHLNASEVLPLMTLGIVLGFVYTRSRNLLAPMFMHGLWNSGTLLSLYILGSGSN